MIGALALHPTGNVQGGFYLNNLATGCIICRRQCTCLHMPTEVINGVHTLAKTENAKKGVNYNDGIPEPNTFHEIVGVNNGDVGVDNNENYES